MIRAMPRMGERGGSSGCSASLTFAFSATGTTRRKKYSKFSHSRCSETSPYSVTGGNQYVGFVQSPDPAPVLLTRYVDPAPAPGRAAEVPGGVDGTVTRWDVWTDDGGDTALVARQKGETLMVFGSVSQAQLEELAGTLTTAPVAG